MSLRMHPLAPIIAGLASVVSGVTARWLDCTPNTDLQRIYFANHSSHLDFVALWAALPPETRSLTRPVAALEFWERNALRRYLARNVFKAVLIERSPNQEQNKSAANADGARDKIAQIIEALGDRNSLIIFPEGTRGDGLEIAAFKSGLYHLSRLRPDTELVPVYINNLNRILPKGEVIPIPLLSGVTFGPPLHAEATESQAAFLERARAAVCKLKEYELNE